MHITVSIVSSNVAISNDLVTIEVGQEMTVADLKAVLEGDINVAPAHQHLFLNNIPLRDDEATLSACGVTDGEMLAMQVRAPASGPSALQNTGQGSTSNPAAAASRAAAAAAQYAQHANDQTMPDADTVRLHILGNPDALALVRQQNPQIAEALNDPARFRQLYDVERRKRMQAEAARQARIDALNADPFNIEAQKEIEELIRQEAVMENLETAMEYTPESFGKVSMLYIPVEVNGVPIKAFVDSGAQVTIMSPQCAERCRIMRLIDKRYGGIAKGVGTADIMGRVHTAQIKIGNAFMASSFTVMEGKHIDLLLGLDMLKRYQAQIDLKDNVLRIGDQAVPFLPDSEIPTNPDEQLEDEPLIKGEDGALIGARSGAVMQPAGNQEAAGPSTASANNPAPVVASRSNAQAAPAAAQSRLSEASISQVMEMGFSRAEAVQALEAAGGDVERAIGILL